MAEKENPLQRYMEERDSITNLIKNIASLQRKQAALATQHRISAENQELPPQVRTAHNIAADSYTNASRVFDVNPLQYQSNHEVATEEARLAMLNVVDALFASTFQSDAFLNWALSTNEPEGEPGDGDGSGAGRGSGMSQSGKWLKGAMKGKRKKTRRRGKIRKTQERKRGQKATLRRHHKEV